MAEPVKLRHLSLRQRRDLDQKVEHMYMQELKSAYQIAKELNYTNGSIVWILKGLRGIVMRGHGGTPLKNMRVNKTKLAQMKAAYLAKPETKKYLKARDLLTQGKTLREAGEAVGLTVGQVAQRMYAERRRKRYGLDY